MNAPKLVALVPVALGLISNISISVEASDTSEWALRMRFELPLVRESDDEELDETLCRRRDDLVIPLFELGLLAKFCERAEVEPSDALDLRLELLDPALTEL
jgi:hypothetical protein